MASSAPQVDGKRARLPQRLVAAASISAFISDRLPEADEQGVGDDGVADVQLVDAVDGRDRLDIVVVQAMPGVDDQAEERPRATPSRTRCSSRPAPRGLRRQRSDRYAVR